jgi:hypothetical protein
MLTSELIKQLNMSGYGGFHPLTRVPSVPPAVAGGDINAPVIMIAKGAAEPCRGRAA